MKYTLFSWPVVIVLFTSLMLFNSCNFIIDRLGPEVDEIRSVKNFNKLEITSGIDVRLSQGNEQKVIIYASEDIIDEVQTNVVNDILKISVNRLWFRGGANVKADVTFTELTSIDVSAGSDVESEGVITFGNIDIEASSGSDLKLNLEASSLYLRVSSGSDAYLKGRTRNLEAKASSGSDIHAYDLEVEDAILECSSGSDIKTFVNGTLNVKASSGSDVHYKGSPRLMDVNTSSGADLIKTD